MSKELAKQNPLCSTVCDPVGVSQKGGKKTARIVREVDRKRWISSSHSSSNNIRNKKKKSPKKIGGAYTLGNKDSHTVIGFSNNSEFFAYNDNFGPMRDKIREALLSVFPSDDDDDDYDIRNIKIGYVISAVLNNFDSEGSRPFFNKLQWIRGHMFLTVFNWVQSFGLALNRGVPEDATLIKCSFQLIHLAEDKREFSEDAPYTSLKSRKQFQNAFNESIQKTIEENKIPGGWYNPILVTPDIRIPDQMWDAVFNEINMMFFHGGETHWLNRRLKKTGLIDALRKNKKIILGGSSAGIINCGVTTGLAASKRYSEKTNKLRTPLVGGDDPLVVLKKKTDANGANEDIVLSDVFPNITKTNSDNIDEQKNKPITESEVQKLLLDPQTRIGDETYPPYDTCDFDGIGAYPGIIFPHVSDKEDTEIYHGLIQEQLPKAVEQYGKDKMKITHVEILSDMHMFLYHQGVSTTYPPLDYEIGTLNTKFKNDMKSVAYPNEKN